MLGIWELNILIKCRYRQIYNSFGWFYLCTYTPGQHGSLCDYFYGFYLKSRRENNEISQQLWLGTVLSMICSFYYWMILLCPLENYRLIRFTLGDLSVLGFDQPIATLPERLVQFLTAFTLTILICCLTYSFKQRTNRTFQTFVGFTIGSRRQFESETRNFLNSLTNQINFDRTRWINRADSFFFGVLFFHSM